MATLNLTFSIPANPALNPTASQAVLTSTNSWTLTVIKGSLHQQIDSTEQFVKVGVNTTHFGQFCDAFNEVGGSKVATFTYSGSVVSALSFPLNGSPVNISLPDP